MADIIEARVERSKRESIFKINPNRPMTHDLFRSFAMNFNFTVEEIVISDLKEGVFFAKIVCSDSLKTVEIDSRPSDAIAVGLRFNVPIYTYENILSEAGIVLNDLSEEEEENKEKEKEKKPKAKQEKVPKEPKAAANADPYKNSTVDQLKVMLDDALNKEDYEKAARIRDELNKRN